MKDDIRSLTADVERAFIGALMLARPNELASVDGRLRREDFQGPRHGEIYDAVMSIAREGRVLGIMNVFEFLQKTQGWTMAEGPDLAEMLSGGVSAIMIPEYARMIEERSQRRHALEAAGRLAAAAEIGSPDEILDCANWAVKASTPRVEQGIVPTLGEEMVARPDDFTGHWEADHPLMGIPTGVPMLDERTSGWRDGTLTVVAARPGVGKTALAVHTSLAAARAGIGVLFVTIEMTQKQIHERASSHISGVDSRLIAGGSLRGDYLTRASDSQPTIANIGLRVSDKIRNPLEIREAATVLGPRIGMVVIDYLGLLHTVGRFGSREQEVAWITRECKTMALDLNKPVILLSQLARPLKGSEGRRPVLSDLKDSGAIESDADLVIFIYEVGLLSGGKDDREHVELIIAKHRNGPTGTIDARYQRETGRFTNWP